MASAGSIWQSLTTPSSLRWEVRKSEAFASAVMRAAHLDNGLGSLGRLDDSTKFNVKSQSPAGRLRFKASMIMLISDAMPLSLFQG